MALGNERIVAGQKVQRARNDFLQHKPAPANASPGAMPVMILADQWKMLPMKAVLVMGRFASLPAGPVMPPGD
jgi:hypothetical protein